MNIVLHQSGLPVIVNWDNVIYAERYTKPMLHEEDKFLSSIGFQVDWSPIPFDESLEQIAYKIDNENPMGLVPEVR